jgi:hypothetical protein
VARPTLWLALTNIVLVATVVVLLLLLVFNVFEQAPVPTLQDEITAANPSVWSPFLADSGAQCKVYPVSHQGGSTQPGPTGPTGVANPRCVPLNSVGSIKTSRKCLKDGCVDLNNQAQPVGYTEIVYQDCTVPFQCQAGTTGCFIGIPSCEDVGDTLVRIQPLSSQCLTNLGSSSGNNVVISQCAGTNRSQQFNFIPTVKTGYGQAYQIGSTLLTNPNTCVVPVGDGTATLSTCVGSYYLTEQTAVNVPYQGIPPGGFFPTTLNFTATVPSQLVYTTTPDSFPTVLPNTYAGLVSFSQSYNSLQGNVLAPFVAACYEPNSLPPILNPSFPAIKQCSATTTVIPTAVL